MKKLSSILLLSLASSLTAQAQVTNDMGESQPVSSLCDRKVFRAASVAFVEDLNLSLPMADHVELLHSERSVFGEAFTVPAQYALVLFLETNDKKVTGSYLVDATLNGSRDCKVSEITKLKIIQKKK